VNVAAIRGFLLQQPKPAAVNVTAGDGEPQPLKLGRSYAKIAETIEALGVDLLECYDDKGVLLRAMRVKHDAPAAARSDAPAIPAGIESDPNALMLTHFANLLHRAYQHSTEVAFSKMVEFVGMMGQRSESIEQRLERSEARERRLHQEQVDDAFERAEEEAERKAAEATANSGDLLQQLAGAFMSGQAQKVPAVLNGKSNGKGKGAS
jgi:hypothetical protein